MHSYEQIINSIPRLDHFAVNVLEPIGAGQISRNPKGVRYARRNGVTIVCTPDLAALVKITSSKGMKAVLDGEFELWGIRTDTGFGYHLTYWTDIGGAFALLASRLAPDDALEMLAGIDDAALGIEHDARAPMDAGNADTSKLGLNDSRTIDATPASVDAAPVGKGGMWITRDQMETVRAMLAMHDNFKGRLMDLHDALCDVCGDGFGWIYELAIGPVTLSRLRSI